ncbi:MAG: helix-turn-helix transcriptional regulator [Terriglobia bacterium]
MVRKKKDKAAYMISNVAKTYDVHPQTLRLYERQGLLKPSRSEGNTRLYTDEDLKRLELILNLTRDLGVNLAGVEIILNMRARVEEMQKEMRQFMKLIQTELSGRMSEPRSDAQNALVRTIPSKMVRLDR